jgi:hypothetical protein
MNRKPSHAHRVELVACILSISAAVICANILVFYYDIVKCEEKSLISDSGSECE